MAHVSSLGEKTHEVTDWLDKNLCAVTNNSLYPQEYTWNTLNRHLKCLQKLRRKLSPLEVWKTPNVERKWFLVLPLFACEKVNQSRHKYHDNLGHYDKFNKDQAIEEALWSDRERQTIDVVQSHGGNGQRQSPWSPRQRPSARLPVLGQPQTQKGPAVSSQRREWGCIQTNPLSVAAPFLSQSNRPGEVDSQLLQSSMQY